jgi:hypothetical protein
MNQVNFFLSAQMSDAERKKNISDKFSSTLLQIFFPHLNFQ